MSGICLAQKLLFNQPKMRKWEVANQQAGGWTSRTWVVPATGLWTNEEREFLSTETGDFGQKTDLNIYFNYRKPPTKYISELRRSFLGDIYWM